MDIANITKYDHVYDHLCSCGANYHMQKHPLGAFVLFEEAKEASLNNVQQLKAEIAALVNEHFFTNENGTSCSGKYGVIAEKLRQLSAV